MKRIIVCLVLCLGLVMTLSARAATPAKQPAQPPKGITISPFSQEVTIRPTDIEQSFEVRLQNTTQYQQDFDMMVINFGTLDETGGLVFAGTNTNKLIAKYGLADWITLDKTVLTLKSGEKTTIKGRITNRDSLSPGGHYAAILASARVPDITGSNKVSFKQTLSSLVFAKKVGGERYDLRLNRIEPLGGNWAKTPDKVRLRFYNPGNVFAVPRGIVRLWGPKDVLLQQGIINEDSNYILPETFRQFYVPLREITHRRFWMVDTYRLSVDYRYDGLDRFANKTITFRVVNISLIIALTGGGLVALLALVVLRKKTKKKHKKKQSTAKDTPVPKTRKIHVNTEDEA